MEFSFWVPQPFDPILEADRIRRLRESVADFDSYDIFVSGDIDSQELVRQKTGLFDRVEALCRELGHRAFIPPKVVGFEGQPNAFDARDTYVLIDEMMIPHCELFLGYMGINSYAVGSMIAKAQLLRKDIIFFYEKGVHLETVAEVLAKVGGCVYRETDSEILRSPRVFYHQDDIRKPLFPYPGIIGVVRFENVDECISKLRPKIEEYFGID